MPAPCGVPLSVSCHSPLSRMPASSHIRISRRTRGSAILCASIRISHSWSTESKKLRMSASSTQFTRWLMSAVCNARQRHVRVPPRPEAVGEPEEVDFVDGAQQSRRPRPGRSCPPRSARRVVAVRHRLSGCRRAAPVVAGSARCGCVRRGPGGLPPGPARTSATVIPSTPALACRFCRRNARSSASRST